MTDIVADGTDSFRKDREETLRRASRGLDASLEEDAELAQEIEGVFKRYTDGPISNSTLADLRNALLLYLEADAADYLLELCARSHDDSYVKEVRSRTSARTWNMSRRLVALFGKNVQEATVIGPLQEDNWKSFARSQYIDATTRGLFVNFEIRKVNGSRFVVDESLDSFLQLTTAMLDAIASIDPELAPGNDLKDETRERFTEVARRTLEVVAVPPEGDEDSPGPESEQEQEGLADPTPPRIM